MSLGAPTATRLQAQPLEGIGTARPPAEVPAAFGLTGRELAVLRLVAAGRTNAQIGAELYISPRTAGVHVTNILRKLGAAGRVQAAAMAERAGLLPKHRRPDSKYLAAQILHDHPIRAT